MNRRITRSQHSKLQAMSSESVNSSEILSPPPKASSSNNNLHFCGIRNLGYTCYANSILQVLYNSDTICTLIRTKKTLGPFHKELGTLFERMYGKPMRQGADGNIYYPSVRPSQFLNAFRAKRSEFVKDEQHDAQEFFYFLLNFLHTETNEALKQTAEPPSATTSLSNAQKVWSHQVEYIDNSPYSRLFMGQIKFTLTCLACGHQSRSWESFWQLQLNVPEGGTVVEGGTVASSAEPVPTLATCIEHFLAEEVI